MLIFEDGTGQPIDLDLRGSEQEVLDRLGNYPSETEASRAAMLSPGPGRPKLGVVCREVSLLPRHWDWLNGQPGGASAALWRLVEQNLKGSRAKDHARISRDAAFRFMWAMAGDLPGFEEASRALSRKEFERFGGLVEDWPPDIKRHVRKLVAVAAADDELASHEP